MKNVRPSCFGDIGIAARDQDAEIAVVRAGVPDLLAVDDPVVAVLFGPRAQRREIRSAAGFAEQLAPDFVRPHRRLDETLALFRRAPGADRRLREVDADAEDAGQDIVFRFFLVVDDVLDRRAAAAAPFDRPVDADEAGVVFAALEVLGAFHRAGGVLAAAIALDRARLAAFGIGIEKGAGFGAECGFFRGVFEIHRCSSLMPLAVGGVAGAQFADQPLLPFARAAQRQAQQFGAPVIQVTVHLPGEAHAAMGLDVFLGNEPAGLAGGDARDRGGDRQFGGVGVHRPGAVIGVGAGQLDLDVHVGELVLDALERSDRPAEGETFLGIGIRHVQRRLRAADLLERHRHGGVIQQRADRSGRAARQRFRWRVGEFDAGVRAGRIEGGDGFPGDAGAVQVHQMQPGPLPPLTATTAMSAMSPSGTASFVPVRRPAADRGGQLRGIGRARPFRQRKCADDLAGGELRQPGLLLLLRPEQHDRLGRQIDRGRERHRRDRAAEFLGQHADREAAEADAAVFLGDRGAGPAHLGDGAPQVGGVGLVGVQDAARHGGRAAIGQEPPRLVAELEQLVGEFEVHGPGPFPPRIVIPGRQRGKSETAAVSASWYYLLTLDRYR